MNKKISQILVLVLAQVGSMALCYFVGKQSGEETAQRIWYEEGKMQGKKEVWNSFDLTDSEE